MTAFTIGHLAVAAFCAVLGMVHLGMYLAVREDRAHVWLAVSMFSFTVLTAGIAGSSTASGGALGPHGVWLAVAIPTLVPLAFSIPMNGCLLFGRVRTRAVAVLIGIGVPLGVTWVVLAYARMLAPDAPDGGYHWEELIRTETTWGVWPLWTALCTIASSWFVEAARSMRARPALALSVAVLAFLCSGVLGWEMARGVGLVQGATLFGLTGPPFVVFASMVMGIGHVRAVREAREGGDRLARYRMIHRLGAGGMGELFLAVRTGAAGFARFVAVKRILSGKGTEELASQARFLAEARLAARLRHPNIVDVHDLGRHEDGWFIVMEYLGGPSLLQVRDRFRGQGGVPPEVAAAVCQQAARGLAAAHAAGVVHRDVSASNVMLTFEGVAKVIDFGVAKAVGGFTEARAVGAAAAASPSSAGGELTHPGHIVGKLSYMAPELLDGDDASSATDTFALGVVLYELLAGRRPFEGSSPMELVRAVRAGTYPPIREACPSVPEPLAAAVERALAPAPGVRFGGCDELAAALGLAVQQLPPVDLTSWVRETFAAEWEAERALVDRLDAADADGRLEPPRPAPRSPPAPPAVPSAPDPIAVSKPAAVSDAVEDPTHTSTAATIGTPRAAASVTPAVAADDTQPVRRRS